MPRAMWSGSISFGLVNVPVKLFAGVSRKSVAFNQIDVETGSRVKMKKVSAADGRDLASEDIIKGYEVTPGQYVTISTDELDALDPKASRTIDLEEFVEVSEIDPIYFDNAYHVAPDRNAEKAYTLLVEAMQGEGKVGLARFVMRNKQYLCAIRPVDGRLVLSTMVYPDEVVDPASIPEMEGADDVELSDKELKMARALIESLAGPFEPERYTDTYRERVLELIDAKAAGQTLAPAPVADESDKVVDLMAALEASVAAAKQARKRHPAASDKTTKVSSADVAGDDDEHEAVKPKSRSRKSA